MKKVMSLVLMMVFMFLLVGCSGSHARRALDFRSVLDTETGTVFSLGDEQAVFEEAFGEGEFVGLEHNRVRQYYYADGLLSVRFYQEEAVEILVATWWGDGYERFEFYDFSFEMTDEELDVYFAGDFHSTRIFDESGQEFFDEFEIDDVVYVIVATNWYLIDGRDGLSIEIRNQRFLNEFWD